MTGSIRRTAQGKMVDINALRLKNERVRAVGNMNVNAKGDLLDADNRSISSRKRQVAGQYRKQITTNVAHAEVASAAPRSSKSKAESQASKKAVPKLPESKPALEPPAKAASGKPSASGLGAAIQRAREIRGTDQVVDPTNDPNPGIVKI